LKNVRVGLIEDHAIVRAGIRMLIEQEPGVEVICESPTATEALSMAGDCDADVLLLDIGLRTENGLHFLPQLLCEFAPAKVLVLTADEDVQTHLAAIEAGARGVVMKEQAPETLTRAIQAVHSGEPWIGPALTSAALARLWREQRGRPQMDRETEKIASLTQREKEVVAVVTKGFNGARISRELNISEATVRHHITSILSKLEVSSKLELAVYAFQHGLQAKPN
jgi:two-component system nitrate/nitrite response regulator NarL